MWFRFVEELPVVDAHTNIDKIDIFTLFTGMVHSYYEKENIGLHFQPGSGFTTVVVKFGPLDTVMVFSTLQKKEKARRGEKERKNK